MNDIERLMWKGGREPTSFPHVCPFRLEGVDEPTCIELSGGTYHQNVNGCCGAHRGSVNFAPCNSVARRCVVCLQLGRRGAKANPVTNIAAGTCNEHTRGIQPEPPRVPLKRAPVKSIIVVREQVPPPVRQVEKPKEISQPTPPPVVEKPSEPEVTFEKKRRSAGTKMAALEEAAVELRKEKLKLQPDDTEPKVDERDMQLGARELIAFAAKKLRMSKTGLSTHFYRSIPNEVKARLLYGTVGRKRTRAEIKFDILMQVREEFRKKGGAPPRKKELAEAAAKPLGMTLFSTRTYIYDRLTPDEVEQLDLRGRFLTLPEQIEVLKKVRQEMKEKGLPAPRHIDLAKLAAPLLRQKVDSVRTLIVTLDEETKGELEFLGSRSNVLAGVDPTVIREGFVGALAVLKLHKRRPTVKNLRRLLKFKPAVVESYLSEHPDVRALLEDDKT